LDQGKTGIYYSGQLTGEDRQRFFLYLLFQKGDGDFELFPQGSDLGGDDLLLSEVGPDSRLVGPLQLALAEPPLRNSPFPRVLRHNAPFSLPHFFFSAVSPNIVRNSSRLGDLPMASLRVMSPLS